ncbi:MAG: pilus assembly PilX N-terminal domain-containing protein [Parcubacteria group bacterium]
MNKNKKFKKNKASALLLATILLFAILTIIISLSSVTVMEMKMSQKGKSSVASFYDAESGVEWALNKIANTNGDIKNSLSPNADGSINCPSGIGVNCKVYFLKEDGTVMTQAEINATTDAPTFADIQAVRSVGREGNETQRAIEAAVAATATGGASFTYYCNFSDKTSPGTTNICNNAGLPQGYCPSGFKQIYDLGSWGLCYRSDAVSTFRPPGGGCYSSLTGELTVGEAYVCSQ